MENKKSIKASKNTIEFLKKFRINRIKIESDLDFLGYGSLLDIIVKYFKYNNDRYLELVKIGEKDV